MKRLHRICVVGKKWTIYPLVQTVNALYLQLLEMQKAFVGYCQDQNPDNLPTNNEITELQTSYNNMLSAKIYNIFIWVFAMLSQEFFKLWLFCSNICPNRDNTLESSGSLQPPFWYKETVAPPFAPPKYRRCITLHPGIGSGYSSFYGQLQSSLFFHEKRGINAPGSISLPFFIIQLSGSRSFPLTSCAFSDLFLSRCSIASCFHTFPHLRLSEATQNPCPLCRLSSYRGTRYHPDGNIA